MGIRICRVCGRRVEAGAAALAAEGVVLDAGRMGLEVEVRRQVDLLERRDRMP